ncbi:MAG: hypothetical protein EAZ26_04310, partial [Runella slithyformis]
NYSKKDNLSPLKLSCLHQIKLNFCKQPAKWGLGSNMVWIAEISNGSQIELKTETVPDWFMKNVLNKV